MSVPVGSAPDAVAIVGMAGRFPGARNTNELWRLLCSGRDALTELAESELLAAGVERQWLRNRDYVRAGMVLDDIESFDADFFGMTAHEARLTDPQQRLLLECAWHALEDAGHATGRGSRVAVYAGARLSEYMLFHQAPPDLFGHVEPVPLEGFQRLLGNDKDYLATRIAYLLDLRGPAITVQTACSTSLVAVHMACQSLLNGECDLALAGGASVRVPQKAGYLYSEGMIFSPDGKTRPFDAKAAGTIFGSGAGFVALRRLDDAVRDGDDIYAVIRGTAVNNDGAGPKAAFTAPAISGQARVIEEALAVADVDPSTVSYVEAHGTGTVVGDPVEVAALTEVFARAGAAAESCAIGAVKANVGHLLQAAGVCGLMKVALMLRHRTLVPAANFSEANPLIDFRSSPFFVNTALREWKSQGPLRAGVSAFGFGGTNAHAVLEEAPRRKPLPAEEERPRVLPVSARSPEAMAELVSATAKRLEDGASLRDLCHSAQTGRASLPHRIAVVASNAGDMRKQLARAAVLPARTTRPRIAFLFSGQGAHSSGMGARLYDTQPVFRASIDESEQVLGGVLEHPLREALFDAAHAPTFARTDVAQPALVALHIALVEWWSSLGITPDAVVGHSLGELSAAWAAGLLSKEDILRFAAKRGRLMHATSPGAMVGTSAELSEIEDLLGPHVSIAAVNAPGQVVVSGTSEAIAGLVASCRNRGAATTILNDRYAFHSALMDPALDALAAAAADLQVRPLRTRFVSTLTGGAVGTSSNWPEHWARQAREKVRYADAIRSVAEEADVCIEIGPDATLTALGRLAVPETTGTWLSSMRKGRDEVTHLLTSLAAAYACGANVTWDALPSDRAQRIALPLYPFQRKRHWIERRSLAASPRSASSERVHPLIGSRVPSPLADAQFTSELSANVAPFARDHWVYGARPLMMVAQLEMMRAAAVEVLDGDAPLVIGNVLVEHPLLLDYDPRRTQTVVGPDRDGSREVRIFTSATEPGSEWIRHSSAEAQRSTVPERRLDLQAIRERCSRSVSCEEIRETKRRKGADPGPAFDGARHAVVGDGEILVEVELTDEEAGEIPFYGAHPGVLDAIPQCADLTVAGGTPHDQLYLPTVLDRVVFHRPLPKRALAYVRRRGEANEDLYGVDASICDDDGRVLCELEGLYFKRATRESLGRAAAPRGEAYDVEWVALPPVARRSLPGRWLVLADDMPVARALAERLSAAGASSVAATVPNELLERAGGEELANVIDLRALPRPGDGIECVQKSLSDLLHVAKGLADEAQPPGLWVVTCGAQATGRETAPLDLFHSSLWGFVRTLQREQPALRCRLIDLDPAKGPDADELVAALTQAVDESEVVMRGGTAYGMRLRRGRSPEALPASWRLAAAATKTIETLRPMEWDRRPPAPGEVEIEVFASGLNFRDVLNASGRIDGPLGYECSGLVLRCGDGVQDLRPGMEVMALAPHSFASHVIADARFVVPRPRNLGFGAAAGSVVAFVSAHYALLERSKIAPGMRVLVHAAAGGVGQAAMQIARAAGATVYATASQGKRELVLALGAERVWDSRAPGFARDLLEVTGGEGVDIVVNTLGAEFLDDNLAVLRRGGTLVDLGHPAVVDLATASSRAAAAGCAFVNFHIAADVATHEPETLRAVIRNVAERLETGALRPLPHRAVALADAQLAFETMMRGAHTGKIVVTNPALHRAALPIHGDGTYVITGGAGALGLRFAEWLAGQGARSIALISRRAPSAVGHELLGRLEKDAVAVRWFEADVSREDSLSRALGQISNEMARVRGVIHAAGTIDDGVLAQQTGERLERVLAPKIRGAWHLHRLLAGRPLDFFVLVSSSAGLWGNPGQSNYASANAFLDQFAHYRRQLGLPALSIDFGPWSGGGMAGAVPEAQRERRSTQGVGELDPERALHLLAEALRHERTHVAVANVEWEKFSRGLPGELAVRFSEVTARRAESRAAFSGSSVFPQSLDEMTSRVARHVAELAGASGAIDVDASLPELGLDSLAVLLLRGRLIADLGEAGGLPVVRFLERRSLAQLAELLFRRGESSPRLSIRHVVPAPSTSREWKFLTPMREGNGAPPFVLVPAAARTALALTDFANALQVEHPVYGLSPAGLDGRDRPHDSIFRMAADYIAELREAFPSGPYLLGGFCFGAYVVWEMARQLAEAGDEPPLVIIFDAGAPVSRVFERSPLSVSRFYYERLRHHLRERSLRRSVAYRLGDIVNAAGKVLRSNGPGAVVDDIIAAHARAQRRYRAVAYPGRVLIVESEQFHHDKLADRWRLLVKGPAESLVFPGTTHEELLSAGHASPLAQRISEYLQRLTIPSR